MKKALAIRLLKIAIALLLLAALYRAADWRQVAQTLRSLDAAWLAGALLLFIPQTVLSAWRWQRLVRPICTISLREAVRQTLASSALNLVTPSKLGDLSKAAMLPIDGYAGKSKACGLVAIEKGADVAALCLLLLVGCLDGNAAIGGIAMMGLLLPATLIAHCQSGGRASLAGRGLSFAAMSLVLWVLHLAQIDCFLRAAGVSVPWTVSFARIPVAIFAGLLPFSFIGLGTRDAALVWLFADVASASTMAGVGALTALRYLVPGVLGIPCLQWRPRQAVDRKPVAALGGRQLA